MRDLIAQFCNLSLCFTLGFRSNSLRYLFVNGSLDSFLTFDQLLIDLNAILFQLTAQRGNRLCRSFDCFVQYLHLFVRLGFDIGVDPIDSFISCND